MIFTDRERRLLSALAFFFAAGYLLCVLRITGVYSADAFFSLETPPEQATTGALTSASNPATTGAPTITGNTHIFATVVERSVADSHFRDGYLELNLADSLELIRLPGIGPALAGRILEVRAKRGRFSSLAELRQVKGIGEKRLSDLRGYLTIHHNESDSASQRVPESR